MTQPKPDPGKLPPSRVNRQPSLPVEKQPNPPLEKQSRPSPEVLPRAPEDKDYEREDRFQRPPGSGTKLPPERPEPPASR